MVNPQSVCCGFLLVPIQMAGILTKDHVNQALRQNKPQLWTVVLEYKPAIPLLLITTNQEIDVTDAVVALEGSEKYKDQSIALDIMKMSPDGGKTLLNVYVGFTFKSAMREVVIAGKDKILPREYLSYANTGQEIRSNDHSVPQTVRSKWWKFWESGERSSGKSSGVGKDKSKSGHIFNRGVCTRCGLSETAIQKFGWECKPAGENTKPTA
jgi:hypothetical protein